MMPMNTVFVSMKEHGRWPHFRKCYLPSVGDPILENVTSLRSVTSEIVVHAVEAPLRTAPHVVEPNYVFVAQLGIVCHDAPIDVLSVEQVRLPVIPQGALHDEPVALLLQEGGKRY